MYPQSLFEPKKINPTAEPPTPGGTGRVGGGKGVRPPFNLIISNIPGPREPLYFNGARLQGVYPMSVPYHGQAMNITCTSYNDQMSFGLVGCRRTAPSLQRLLIHLDDELQALEESAGLS